LGSGGIDAREKGCFRSEQRQSELGEGWRGSLELEGKKRGGERRLTGYEGGRRHYPEGQLGSKRQPEVEKEREEEHNCMGKRLLQGKSLTRQWEGEITPAAKKKTGVPFFKES